MRPLERFLGQESASGAILMAAAVVALVWANASPGSYHDVWSTATGAGIGGARLDLDLGQLVNELLMAVFFYVVALEVKREWVFGGLRDRSYAALPAAAAFGTMIGAATTYVAVNLIGDGNLDGWAIPVATDIAFSVAALGLVGRRAPAELRTFLLTLAVVDDLATIAVIAIFYSGGIEWEWLAGAFAAIGVVLVLQRAGVRSLIPYVVVAGAMWIATHESGIHATIAGVALGFLTPAHPLRGRGHSDEETAPLVRMEEGFHPWSAYVVLPIFALANAGVHVSPGDLGNALSSPVGLGILLGLVVGAPIGGILLPMGLARLTGAKLPGRLDWSAIAAMAPLKGIGFTVAIFISLLAFDDPGLQQRAILSILVASVLAGLIGISSLLLRHRRLGARAA